MLFNSLEFIIFLVLVFGLFGLTPYKFRWLLILAASYFFYGFWNVSYLGLILFTTFSSYYLGIRIAKAPNQLYRKFWCSLAISLNLAVLFFFKYFNFLASTVNDIFSLVHENARMDTLDLLLPVGISFYTFQAIGYVIEIYRKELQPESHLGAYALFISFFPQLVAGPIERPGNLIPQLKKNLVFDREKYLKGISLILSGFIKKLVIADRLAIYVDTVYGLEHASSQQYWLATLFFSFQIYCDFSGYTDIARGTANLFGIDLMRNFKRPYLAKSFREFWSRWHISLSSWFRDYLYIPLGGSREGKLKTATNLFIVFAICGLWHGASWTFVAWGTVHGILLIINHLILKKIPESPILFRPLINTAKIAGVFFIINLSWVLFRSDTIEQAFQIYNTLFTRPFFFGPSIYTLINPSDFRFCILLIISLTGYELFQEVRPQYKLSQVNTPLVMAAVHATFLVVILLFGEFLTKKFVYFQF